MVWPDNEVSTGKAIVNDRVFSSTSQPPAWVVFQQCPVKVLDHRETANAHQVKVVIVMQVRLVPFRDELDIGEAIADYLFPRFCIPPP